MGIGASAGGLEALERLFGSLEADVGAAFIVVQHLSPDFNSVMHELIARRAKLRVVLAEHGASVEPNVVYVLPPKAELTLQHGRLFLTQREPRSGLWLPIDIFFRSLAADARNRAIAVILSGTGSDGSRGIRAVHESGGLVFAQNEDSARFTGMPRNAADTGIVDAVLTPEEIASAITDFARDRFRLQLEIDGQEDEADDMFELLQRESGIDFSYYKGGTVIRRVERRLLLNQSPNFKDYLARLREDPVELQRLYQDLLIGVTGFFRDPEAFTVLAENVFPSLIERLAAHEELRIWSVACATGEEAYSLAILAREAFRQAGQTPRVKVFATDVHRLSLERASVGLYRPEQLDDLPQHLRDRYFRPRGDRLQVTSELRSCVVFANHNVLRDAPFTKIDLASCRNLLIYFKTAAQRKALSMLHFALKPQSALLLGPSESLGAIAEEFTVVDRRWKIFRKRRDVRLSPEPNMSNPVAAQGTKRRPPREKDGTVERARNLLLERFSPPTVLIGTDFHVHHTFNGGGRFLAPRDGEATLNLLELVDGELKFAIAGAVRRALQDRAPSSYGNVMAQTLDGPISVRVLATPLETDGECDSLLLSFEQLASARDVETPVDLDALTRERIETLEHELRLAKENLQATIEEMEASNQELQATNEELIASNEELQSTNEELQSVNEELYTVNAEYQLKIRQLTELTSDMNHLLEATEVHTIFLDHELHIRRFTPKMAETFNLVAHDIGRRIDHFAHQLVVDDLVSDLEQVLRGTTKVEREVCDRKGTKFLLRIVPYRPDNVIEGVVLTLVDVSPLARAQAELVRQEASLRSLLHPVPIAAWTQSSGATADGGPTAVEAAALLVEEQLHEISDRLDDLQSLRALSRGLTRFQRERVELGPILREAVEALSEMTRARNVELEELFPTESLAVIGDRAGLHQLVTRLLQTAIRVNRPHGPLRVRACRKGKVIELAVDRDGVSSTADHPHHQRSLEQDTLPEDHLDLGVDFALVRQLARHHGGEASVLGDGHNRAERTFRVTLPADHADETTMEEARTHTFGASPNAERLRIVIVEDNEDAREMMTLLLELQGHEVVTANNGEEGARLIIDTAPDLALVDIGLPEVSGYEVAKRVRSELGRDIYLAALTGYGREEDREAVFAAGFDEHIIKPLRPERLQRVLASVTPTKRQFRDSRIPV